MIGFILGFCLGMALVVIIKNHDDMRDIKEFERMHMSKLKEIQRLKAENKRLHNTVTDLQIELAVTNKKDVIVSDGEW